MIADSSNDKEEKFIVKTPHTHFRTTLSIIFFLVDIVDQPTSPYAFWKPSANHSQCAGYYLAHAPRENFLPSQANHWTEGQTEDGSTAILKTRSQLGAKFAFAQSRTYAGRKEGRLGRPRKREGKNGGNSKTTAETLAWNEREKWTRN